MESTIINQADELLGEMIEISKFMYENPEISFEEKKSSQKLMEFLEKYNFVVEKNPLGMETGFIATFDSKKQGQTVGFFAEYDALPEIGHGCGHNMIGTVSASAAIACSQVLKQTGGKIIVFGTPAEETSGAKVNFADAGFFDKLDVALMAHPADDHYASGTSSGLQPIEFTFKGKTAHAASDPEKGLNALDGLINTFNLINALRQQMRNDGRIHGIIRHGGEAANIIPDYAVGEFYVRAGDNQYLDELVEKVRNCAIGGAMAAGVELSMRSYEARYDCLVTNEVLSAAYIKRLKEISGIQEIKNSTSAGSLDMGNVSRKCPAIHPYFAITPKKINSHSVEFAQATQSTYAINQMPVVVKTLALTAYDVLRDKELVNKIHEEFQDYQFHLKSIV